jgi:hypothetical protein
VNLYVAAHDRTTLLSSQEHGVNLSEHSFKLRSRSLCRTPERHACRPVSPDTFHWSSMMKKLAIVFAVGATALMGGSAAYAADNAAKSKSPTDESRMAGQSSTDISAQYRRHWHGHHHWGHRHYRPYYGSYNYYAPRRYGYYGPRYYGGYGPRYYGGGPGVTFSFGTGGYRW